MNDPIVGTNESKWIYVRDRLPPFNSAVNVLMAPENSPFVENNGPYVSYAWLARDGYWSTLGGSPHEEPIAWQELPSIPEILP